MAITYHAGRRIQGLEADVTLIQGYAGGETPNPTGTGSGAGGGGAGGIGATPTGNVGGAGGIGLSSSITGSAVTRAGGGGGGGNTGSGAGGSGIGGSGGNPGGNATGYGSGGGGGSNPGNGGSGSDGIVIIRFTTSGNGYSQAGGTVDSSTVSGQTIISWTATSGTRTFTPTSTFNVQYLILAGGGGGASYYWAGGGGAGGYRTATDKEVTAQAYTIVVGAGGAVQSTQHTAGNNGSDSSALGLTSIGGGGGGTNAASGNNGGSGGGCGGGGGSISGGTGTLTDLKPTDVQVGSRFEETDTRKMYHKVDVTGSDVSLTGLKAYYKFNEASGNIINQAESVGSSDSIGTNADMTITGATYDQTGIIGKALSFDGSNDYGTLGSSLSNFNFLHGTGDWSINFWVKYDEFIAEDRFLSNLDSTELRGMDMAVGWNGDPDGSLGMAIKSDNGFMVNQGGFTFPATVSAGAWVMITMTCDYSDTTNTYKVYLNGSAGGTQARGTTGSTGNSEYSLKLACRGNAVNKFFDGSFDELSIWQRELSQSEITSLYNSGNGKEINSDAWSELGT